MSWLINRKVTAGFGLAVAILTLVGWSSYRATVEFAEAAKWRKQTQDVLANVRVLLSDLSDLETGARGFALTGQESFLEIYGRALPDWETRVRNLEQLTSDNPPQQSRIEILKPLIREKISHLNTLITIRQSRGLESAADFVSTGIGKQLMDGIRQVLSEMEGEENELLRIRDENVQASSRNNMMITSLGSLLSLLLVLWAGFAVNRDINAREQAERHANDARNYAEEIIATIREPLLVLTRDLRVRTANRSFYLAFQTSPEETENRFLYELGEGQWDLPALRRRLEGILPQDARLEDFEVQNEFPKIGRRTMLLNARKLYRESNHTELILLAMEDITERKRAVEELARFFTLSIGLHCIAGFDGYFKRLNPAWAATLGFTNEELLAKPFLDFVHPEDRERTTAEAQKLASGATTVLFENRYLCKDGSYRWISWNAIPFPDQRLIFASAQDITERKQAEEAREEAKKYLDSIINAIADPVFVKDRRHRWVLFNEAFRQFLGYRREELLGKSDSDVFPKEQADVFWEKDEAVLQTAEENVNEELLTDAAGRTHVIVTKKSLYTDRKGEKYIVGVIRDVTQSKQAEEALRRAKEAAEEGSRFKDQFLSTMSHELRTPLNAILGFSDLLGDERYGTLNERQRRYVNHIHTAGQHLLRLINDVLDLSKIEAGRMELAMEKVSVPTTFNDVVETLRLLAEKKSQTLSHHAEPDLTVRADPTRFRQVLLNLAGNAIKFTPEGGKIELRARPENGQIRLEVHDNGPGIPAEEQQHVFDAFSRLHQTAQAEGTGLGLAISQRLVELHKGRMGLESQPGQGSCFYFTLPAALPVLKEPTPQAEPVESSSQALRVLVIEDDPAAGQLIQSHLASSGHEVVICDQPQRAAEMATELQPHVITLDLLMRPTSGWEVLLQLKLDPRTQKIPVVVVTIVNQPGQGAAFVADEYLVKPVDKPTLLAAINRCLSSRGIAAPARPILVVEDDEAVREVINEILIAERFAVVTAADGAEARNSVAASLPELVVLDLMLPKISGFELLAEWRANPRTADLPVFVLTGKDLTQEEEQYLRAHAESLFQKRTQWQEDLTNQLRRVLGPSRATKQ